MDLIAQAAEIMLTEAQHMEAAAQRFQARRPSRAPRATTKAGR
jgi:hypothetical protein